MAGNLIRQFKISNGKRRSRLEGIGVREYRLFLYQAIDHAVTAHVNTEHIFRISRLYEGQHVALCSLFPLSLETFVCNNVRKKIKNDLCHEEKLPLAFLK